MDSSRMKRNPWMWLCLLAFSPFIPESGHANLVVPRVSIELNAEPRLLPLESKVCVRTVLYAKAQARQKLASILRQWNVSSKTIDALASSCKKLVPVRFLREGRTVKGTFDANSHELLTLEVQLDGDRILTIQKGSDRSFSAWIEDAAYQVETVRYRLTINKGLITDAEEAGLSSSVATGLRDIFSSRIDLSESLKRGDSATILIETLSLHGQFVRFGSIVAAEFQTTEGEFEAFLYEQQYYDANGECLRPSILSNPVEDSVLGAPFGERRFSPATGHYRYHKGIDLVVPLGTPVHATGEGTISFIGNGGSYGRLIKIQHDGTYSTLYAHLLKFSPGLEEGSVVHQGEVIGYVGQSGRATGPHLHYELHQNDRSIDPLTAELPSSRAVLAQGLPLFLQQVEALRASLAEPHPAVALKARQP